MSNWATMRDIEKDRPRVSDIFTRKPYGAANDLGKILRKKRRQAYYQANKERIKAKARENYYKRKERRNE